MKNLLLIALIFLFACNGNNEKNKNNEWISLFNGENLDNWVIKFNHHEIGENYNNTFRVKDGKLVVDYSDYDSIADEFGHIYYKEPFSSYTLKLEYRFTSEQPKGGAGWAFRNNGVMFHCQEPATILRDQPFPVSLEAQLLGGRDEGERPTGNVCTPGTHVEIEGKLVKEHCINSRSKTYRGDQWVDFELVVYGDSIVHHIVEGDTVLTYRNLIIGGDLPENFPLPEGFALNEGYIALQAESHPTEFRNIRLKKLK